MWNAHSSCLYKKFIDTLHWAGALELLLLELLPTWLSIMVNWSIYITQNYFGFTWNFQFQMENTGNMNSKYQVRFLKQFLLKHILKIYIFTYRPQALVSYIHVDVDSKQIYMKQVPVYLPLKIVNIVYIFCSIQNKYQVFCLVILGN